MTAPGTAGLWRLRLSVRSGPDSGKSCAVIRDTVTVGKHPDCDLVLTDETVSRRHLRITRTHADRWLLTDLGSTNGTWLQGARLKEAPIEAGAVFSAGTAEIAFVPEREILEVPLWEGDRFGAMLGRSEPMRRVFALAARLAQTDATVLIQGETGTGKGVLARAIVERSLRAGGPFVVVDSGAVKRELIESELFGHEKGAFSDAHQRRTGAFEAASGGTVFIDELAELALDLQPKLLRVLEAREVRPLGASEPVPVDIRVIAASRRDLRREVERGAFREDLYFRLSVVTLDIPPLRARADDIPLLAELFVESTARDRGLAAPRLDAAILDRLTCHDWPGNVRELKNVLERAVLLASVRAGGRLEVGALSRAGSQEPLRLLDDDAFDPALGFGDSKERYLARRERAYLEWLLARAGGNVSKAARDARMDRKYLHKLMRRHGIA